MESKPNLGKELKALGNELAGALKQIRSSQEFKELEREVTSGVKNISTSLMKGLKAARQSENTSKLKSQLGRVVKAGRVQGKIEAEKARRAAAVGIKKARLSLRELTTKVKKRPKGA